MHPGLPVGEAHGKFFAENLIITDREEALAFDDREYVKHGL
jgi:hypothetical protein